MKIFSCFKIEVENHFLGLGLHFFGQISLSLSHALVDASFLVWHLDFCLSDQIGIFMKPLLCWSLFLDLWDGCRFFFCLLKCWWTRWLFLIIFVLMLWLSEERKDQNFVAVVFVVIVGGGDVLLLCCCFHSCCRCFFYCFISSSSPFLRLIFPLFQSFAEFLWLLSWQSVTILHACSSASKLSDEINCMKGK